MSSVVSKDVYHGITKALRPNRVPYRAGLVGFLPFGFKFGYSTEISCSLGLEFLQVVFI